MRRSALLPGLILIGLGSYFLLVQLNLPQLNKFLSWQMILIIIGLAFMISSSTRDTLILPGTIMLLLGIHYWGLDYIKNWPEHWSYYLVIVGVAFLLTFVRTQKSSFLIPAVILLVIPFITRFVHDLHFVLDWWPIVLIILGLYFLFFKRGS